MKALWLILIVLLTTLIFLLWPARPIVPYPLPTGTTQVLRVQAKGQGYECVAFHQQGNDWQRDFSLGCIVGRNGIAGPDAKREGDGMTPSGVFRIGHAFGEADGIQTRLTYLKMSADCFWIDDPKSPDYNRLVRGARPAVSHEEMKRSDTLYQWGAVIEYNTDPIIPGAGSAIFLHIWEPGNNQTAGCVALQKEDLRRILAWLDPAAQPVIAIVK
jgi:L,D-peptidoglycan transpeptidase YkuD (ErfK/YbiS/YcfS/YnhG family)